jgi:WD40 repeat protein
VVGNFKSVRDNVLLLYDIRKRGPAGSILGPQICGDTIDFKNDGYTVLTGSYRQKKVLELWDIRKFQKFRDIEWNGPISQELFNESSFIEGNDNESSYKSMKEDYEKSPFIYSCLFNDKFDRIMAGGAHPNQVRMFDYNSGSVICSIDKLQGCVLTLSQANNSSDFAFGATDSKIRLMTQQKNED